MSFYRQNLVSSTILVVGAFQSIHPDQNRCGRSVEVDCVVFEMVTIVCEEEGEQEDSCCC